MSTLGSHIEAYAKNHSKPLADVPKHIRSLTSARFIASFAIVLYHFKDQMGFDITPYTQLLKSSYVGVDFFFILSGFIMAHSYGAQIVAKSFSFSDFIKRRFARIYPVHLVTLLAFCALGVFFYVMGIKPNIPEKYTLEAVPVNLLLLQAWGLTSEGTFNTPSWSISAEWLAYLLFLPMSLLILRLKTVGAMVSALALLFGFYTVIPFVLDDTMTGLAHHFGILRIVPEFFYGIAFYMFLVRYQPTKRVSTLLWWGSLGSVLLCLHFHAPDIVMILLFGGMIYALAARSCYGQDHVLDNRVLVYLGEVSYSMYMVHALVYTLVFNGVVFVLPHLLPTYQIPVWLFAVVITFPAAMISYHGIEEPARKWLNRFGNKKAETN